ncbi:MAG: stalk domain-containing protein, partial [Bacillota bacterium]|nr:stalk domain-containing protein [Bacillota bacterium]
MKKRMILIAAICSLWMAVPVFAGIGVSIDGKSVNFTASGGEPVMDENGRTLVPLRAAMEAYGCTVSWDKVSRTASVFKDQTVVQVPVGQNKVTVNGTDVATDTQARIIEGRVYLPIRAVLEAFGASVGWDQASQTVTVRSAEGGEKHTGTPQKAALTAQEISEKCSPAVFFIKVYGFNGEMKGSGSGFFLSSDGLAVTNHHVIANSQYIEITTVDGYTTHDVKVIDYDKENDLA